MADLKTNTTSYPSSVDSYTNWADSTDDVVAASVNNILSAVIAIETELGASLKGTATNLAARMAVNLAQNGSVPSGTSFPVSPTPVGGQFYVRTDYSPWRLYMYDGTLAQWNRVESITDHGVLTGLADDDHTQYVHNTTARTVTANHTFSGNPVFSGTPNFSHATGVSPFTVVSTTKVENLNVDKVDDLDTATASTASTLIARDSNGDATARVFISDVAIGTAPIAVSSTTKVANLNVENSDTIDNIHASSTATANYLFPLGANKNLALPTPTSGTHTINGVEIATVNSNVASSTSATSATSATNCIQIKEQNSGVYCKMKIVSGATATLIPGDEETITFSNFFPAYSPDANEFKFYVSYFTLEINASDAIGDDSYQWSFKAIGRDNNTGALHGYLYKSGGYGTLPADPSLPGTNRDLVIRLKNTSSSNAAGYARATIFYHDGTA